MQQRTLDDRAEAHRVSLEVFINPDGTLSHFEIIGRRNDGSLVSWVSTNVPGRSVEGTALRNATVQWTGTVREAQESLH